MDLESEMKNYQKVKEIVLNKLVQENLLDASDATEFDNRCQVLVYKGTWWSKWFDKNVKGQKDGYYIRMVELCDKEDEIDRLLRRTTGDYDE